MRVFWNLFGYLSDLAGEHPWTSWVMHGLIAVPIAWAFGATAVFVFYGLREAEQVIHRKINGVPLDSVDHIMDVLVPVFVAGAVEVLVR